MSKQLGRVDTLIQRVMARHPGTSASQDAKYYEDVHQELAPLARELELEVARLKADMQAMWRLNSKTTPRWKCGNEYAPFHPSASHVSPAYRDGWNDCYIAAQQNERAKQ